MVKAVIFDIDGTIIDSVGAHIEAWRRTFARFGKEVSDEEIRRHIGEGSDDMLPVFFSPEELHRFRPLRCGSYSSGLKTTAKKLP
jgi:HAD superfamily hydrolase (TIGR01549 family)